MNKPTERTPWCECCCRDITEEEFDFRHPMAGTDFGQSHYFCEECLEKMELHPNQGRVGE